MKFTAKSTDIGHIESFVRTINTVTKLSKNLILRITEDHMYFTKHESLKDGSFKLWCDILANRFFEDFRMEGMSSEQNEIYLELDSEAFGRAVRSANNAKYLRMKLTKKNVPYLALEMKFPSTTSRVVTHDVPVRVVAPRLWKEYAEPDVPKFHSSLYLPPVKMIHKVATSMKNMIVKHMVISANNDGEMNFKIESDVATLTTHFGDLVRPDWKDEEHNRLVASQLEPEDENFDRSKFYSVRIEVKTLLQFLNNQQIVFCRLMANIVHMKYLHLYVSNDDFRLQYFIPAVLY